MAACACAGRRTGAGRQGGKHAFRQAWQRGMAGANTANLQGSRQAGSSPALTPSLCYKCKLKKAEDRDVIVKFIRHYARRVAMRARAVPSPRAATSVASMMGFLPALNSCAQAPSESLHALAAPTL